MNLESGFYLSPNGKHIVEIYWVADNKHCQSADIDFDGHHLKCDGDLFWLAILFEGWERLT